MTRLFDARQYGVLFSEGVRLTLTGSRGAAGGASEDGSRHLLGAAYSLTLSTVVAWILMENASPGQFLLVTTSLSMIFTATSVIGELADGLFHPQDLAVTGHLPVSGITRFAARFSELLFFLGILTLNFNLGPAVLFCFMMGGSPAAPLACIAAGFCAAVFTAGVCLVLYILMARFMTALQFQGALLYLNILVTLFIMGLLINVGRLFQIELFQGAAAGTWPVAVPPAWFAGAAMEVLGFHGGGASAGLAALAGLGAALLPLLLAALGSDRLLQALGRGTVGDRGRSAPGPVMGVFETLFLRPGEKAAFEFTAVNLARDRGFRLKTYPIMGIPVLIISMSLFDERHPLFFIFMLHLANLYLPLVLAFLPYGDHFQGGWIFASLPVEGRRTFSVGAEKAFIFRVSLPLLVINAAVLALVWDPLAGCANALYAFFAGLFITGVKFRALPAYPFTREFKGGVSTDLFGEGFIVFFLFALLIVVHGMAYSSIPAIAVLILAMAILHKVRFTLLVQKTVAAEKAGAP